MLSLSGNGYQGLRVRCKPDYMELTLTRKHYARIDPATLRLTDPSCGPYFYNSSIMIIRAPLGGCGTKAGPERNLLGFRNEVYADLTGRSPIAREPAYQFRLHCLYYTTAKIMLHSFKPDTKVIVEPPTGKTSLTPKLPWATKAKFLLTKWIQCQADKWWIKKKYRLGDYLLIPYQILQSNIIITMADSEENH